MMAVQQTMPSASTSSISAASASYLIMGALASVGLELHHHHQQQLTGIMVLEVTMRVEDRMLEGDMGEGGGSRGCLVTKEHQQQQEDQVKQEGSWFVAAAQQLLRAVAAASMGCSMWSGSAVTAAAWPRGSALVPHTCVGGVMRSCGGSGRSGRGAVLGLGDVH